MGELLGVIVNGIRSSVSPSATIQEIVDGLATSSRGIAVALDGEIIPRSQWAATTVGDGAVIEIVTAAAGG
jgi:sulfur carrier protein